MLEQSQRDGDWELKPRLAFRVGVVGHRDLQVVDNEELAQGIRSILSQVKNGIGPGSARSSWGYAQQPAALYLITSLAEGVDQLAAQVGLEEELGYELRCPLPFPAQAYLSHFDQEAEAARTEFARLAGDRNTVLIELDGFDQETRQRRQGYREAADLVVEHSDLLLVVLDPDREGKAAGTAETLSKATAAGIPVVCMDPDDPSNPSLIVEGKESGPGPAFANDLQRQVLNVVAPHRERAANAGDQPDSTRDDELEEAKRQQRTAWERFYREPLARPDAPGFSPFQLLRLLYMVFWRGLLGLGDLGEKLLGRSHPADPENFRAKTEASKIVGSVQAPYKRPLEICDRLAGFYMDLYRGSFAMNYAFGAFAVIFGLLSYFHTAWESFWLVGELFILAGIAFNVLANRVWKWQDRAVEYRFLAEHFRHMLALAPLARVAPWTRLPAHNTHGDPDATWMNAYFRAVVRSAGLVGSLPRPGTLSLAGDYQAAARQEVSERWLLGQQRYHGRQAHRFHFLHELLHGSTLVLFIATVVACFLHMSHLGQSADEVVSDAAAGAWRPGALLTILAVACPTLIAAIHGLLAQAEFHRIAARSKALAGHLARARLHLKVESDMPHSGQAAALGSRTVEIAGMMLEEVLEWRMIYTAHATQLT